jgi:hypothetical protein
MAPVWRALAERWRRAPPFDWRTHLRYYADVAGCALALSAPCIAFVYALSLVPWLTLERGPRDYYSRPAAHAALYASFTAFGPVYIFLVVLIVAGGRAALRRAGWFLVHCAAQAVFWPLVYASALRDRPGLLFYYVDFAWFALCFLPLTYHGAHAVLWNQDAVAPLGGARSAADRRRMALAYTASELVVIVAALGYNFFLFPVYTQLRSDWQRLAWRLVLHPLWFEAVLVLPARVMVKNELCIDRDEWRFLPAMHALFHSATMGRMLIVGIGDPLIALAATVASNAIELALRLSAHRRDRWTGGATCYRGSAARSGPYAMLGSSEFELRLRSGGSPDSATPPALGGMSRSASTEAQPDEDVAADLVRVAAALEPGAAVHAQIVNVEMLVELVGIVTGPAVMIFFRDAGAGFFFRFACPAAAGAAPVSVAQMLALTAAQLAVEVPTDLACVWHEVARAGLPLVAAWRLQRTPAVLAFLCYGTLSMAVLGVVYCGMVLPRAGPCTDALDLCSCAYPGVPKSLCP